MSAFVLTACGGAGVFAADSSPAKVGRKACELEVKNALLAPAPAKTSVREWTVMIFISGKNDLNRYAFENMRQMEKVGSDDKVAIVTQLGTLVRNDKVDRYLVTSAGKKKNDGLASAPVDSVKADMGSWTAFSNFAVWAMKKYPARRYALVLWNHGTGWSDFWGPGTGGAELSVGLNDLSLNEIRMGELGRAMRQIKARSGRSVDLLAFDACYMAMLSVMAEIKDYASVITASQDIEPNTGYPYGKILAALRASPDMTAEDLGARIVKDFGTAYDDGKESAIKTSALPAVFSALSAWSDAVMASGAVTPAAAAKVKTEASYGYYNAPDDLTHPMSADLCSYVSLVSADKKLAKNKAVSAAAEEFNAAVKNAVIASTGDRVCGVAEYLPRYAYRPSYDDTAFARLARWDDFLKWTIKPGLFKQGGGK